MISHVIMGSFSLVAGSALGSNYGGLGVAIGTVNGLIAGSLFLLVSHIKQVSMRWYTFIIPKDMAKLLLLGFFVTFLSNYASDQQPSLMVVLGVALLCGALLLTGGWFNPGRTMLLRWGKQ
jgi:O-antigen/teichoic acid export membrane protein